MRRQVIYAVSMKHQRPDIGESCPPALRSLIERCWAHDVDTRPRSDELLRELNVLYDEAVELEQRRDTTSTN
jgi:hypothetical protein